MTTLLFINWIHLFLWLQNIVIIIEANIQFFINSCLSASYVTLRLVTASFRMLREWMSALCSMESHEKRFESRHSSIRCAVCVNLINLCLRQPLLSRTLHKILRVLKKATSPCSMFFLKRCDTSVIGFNALVIFIF